MTSLDKKIKRYAAGERFCRACAGPLPGHETWPNAIFRWCNQKECLASMRVDTVGRYVAPKTLRCDGPDCANFVAEGRYDRRAKLLYCSSLCWKNRILKGTRPMTCACGCGEEFLGTRKQRSPEELHFKSKQHYSDYRFNKYLKEFIGPFRDIVVEYLDGFAKRRYADLPSIRKALGPFFTFLNEQGISSIEDVSSKTIYDFLNWAEKIGRLDPKNKISFLSTFFKWAISVGHRKAGNPVLPGFHGTKKTKTEPRPLETEESKLVWQLLHERGNAKLRLVVALGEEAGLRISELARIQLSDIDLVRRRVFVRLPTKGKRTRWAFFSSKTIEYHKEWIAERDPSCGHNSLFYNSQKGPASDQTLRRELKEVLLKNGRETGFDTWSTHRLRHTMASTLAREGADANLILAQGGWKSLEAMSVYARMDPELARKSYDEAMRRSNERKSAKPTKRSLNLDEYLMRVSSLPN